MIATAATSFHDLSELFFTFAESSMSSILVLDVRASIRHFSFSSRAITSGLRTTAAVSCHQVNRLCKWLVKWPYVATYGGYKHLQQQDIQLNSIAAWPWTLSQACFVAPPPRKASVPHTIILNCSSGQENKEKPFTNPQHQDERLWWTQKEKGPRESLNHFCALSCYPNLPLTRRSHCLRRVILQTKCSVKRMADHLSSFSEKYIEKHQKALHKMETKKVYVYMSYHDMCYIIYIHTRTHNLFTAYWSTDCTSLQALELHVKASR